MCLIAFAWRAHPGLDLVVAANRDEFHARESAPAARWPGEPTLYGGRDEVAGGSWLLVAANGRFAAVTNLRRPGIAPRPRSRGALVHGFVAGHSSPAEFVAGLADSAMDYGPFNLLLVDRASAWLASNHEGLDARALAPGVHALSNGPVGEDWPKMRRLAPRLETWLAAAAGDDPDLEPLLDALLDPSPAPDPDLPDTGIGIERERWLSAPFVRGREYGTRCSTVLVRGAHGFRLVERRFGPDAVPAGESRLQASFPGA